MAGPAEYHWTFGDRCHIRFPNGGDPELGQDHAFQTNEGCACISDASGNLLFYTDGSNLYDGTLTNTTPIAGPLGGDTTAAHSAIIIPPAGSGSLYHIIATTGTQPLTHTAVDVSGSVATIPGNPTQLTFGPKIASERLAAIPHTDCKKYWVVSLDSNVAGAINTQVGNLYAMLIDSDGGPSVGNTVTTPYPMGTETTPISGGWCIKFSPDGSLLAITKNEGIDILSFDRATGVFTSHSHITGLTGGEEVGGLRPYGVEFSPNGQYLYYSGISSGIIRRHTIIAGGTSIGASSDKLIGTVPSPDPNGVWAQWYTVGALQLGPNGKIYGARMDQTNRTLLEIADPNNSDPSNVGFSPVAKDKNNNNLILNNDGWLGLPTFTRISDDCIDDGCEAILANVEDIIAERCDALVNKLEHCDDTNDCDCSDNIECKSLKVPAIKPCISIRWGDSDCDGLETDDFEVMCISVCNCYSNLNFKNFSIMMLEVVDQNGDPVQTLPDGSPSVQIYPIGPHCFGDIPPCGGEEPNCVTREFVVKTCGAVEGDYEIRLSGICFDVSAHINTSDCLKLTLCKS